MSDRSCNPSSWFETPPSQTKAKKETGKDEKNRVYQAIHIKYVSVCDVCRQTFGKTEKPEAMPPTHISAGVKIRRTQGIRQCMRDEIFERLRLWKTSYGSFDPFTLFFLGKIKSVEEKKVEKQTEDV